MEKKKYDWRKYRKLKGYPPKLPGTAHSRFLARKRKQLFELKSALACVDCGIRNPLCIDFDHVDRSQKLFCISAGASNGTPWKRVLEEIAKCVPRCTNCHRIKTALESQAYKDLDITPYIQNHLHLISPQDCPKCEHAPEMCNCNHAK